MNKDGFLSFAEFSAGIDSVMAMSGPIKEKFFSAMDSNHIGMIDYSSFLQMMQAKGVADVQQRTMKDSFDWENSVISSIKDWILQKKITVEEAFKCFDKDFDGVINKTDLRQSMISLLKIKEEEILPTKVDRILRLMDFYKTGSIQLSDFQRLLKDQNPYSTTGRQTASSDKFRSTFGGSLGQTSTFDWKLSAIQQMGLSLSKQYPSLKHSFDEASEMLLKITFE